MSSKSEGLNAPENRIDLREHPRHAPQVEGTGNHLEIGEGTQVESLIVISGDDNRLIIGDGCTISGFAPAGGGTALIDPKPGAMASLTIRGRGNTVEIDPKPGAMASLTIRGRGNTVEIDKSCRLGTNITVVGDNSRIRLGPGCAINGFISLLSPTGCALLVGAGTTMVQVSIQLHEPGQIIFGEDCMVSSQAYVSLSDIHPIYDRATGQRANAAADVIIGDHVWLGLRSMIMKGAKIGDGAVVAAGAILSGSAPDHAIMAGVPARVVRENIIWRRELSEGAPEPEPMLLPSSRSWWPFGASHIRSPD
ncbi:acyltransferase [Caulobacter sp. ErkDOM-YI]|uniref:acyltransferase n=1 Tax=unclassified Caulobacter TaxID=2648921 RepID=UPI003AF88B16